MIKTENGLVEVEGTIIEVTADLICILRSIRNIIKEQYEFLDADDFIRFISSASSKKTLRPKSKPDMPKNRTGVTLDNLFADLMGDKNE